MLETWILSKLEPYKQSRMVILRDPQRMIRTGARAVDGWALENGFTVLFCTGNLALREMYERLRDDVDADGKVLLVDRSRDSSRLFYPDLEAASSEKPLKLSLRDFLVEKTDDYAWPAGLIEDRNIARLMLANLDGVLEAYRQLRQVSSSRFTDGDFYRIVLGAALHINPFVKLSASQVRRLCLEQHSVLDELNRILPETVKKTLRQIIESAPRPFCRLLDQDPELIVRAFTLSAILHEHGLDHSILLTHIDLSLHPYKSIENSVLDNALEDLLLTDPESTLADVVSVEEFLKEDPQRLAFLLRDQLGIDEPITAIKVLKKERLSGLIRSMALASLLVDLIRNKDWRRHQKVLDDLEKQEQDARFPISRRPSEQWQQLLAAYRRAVSLFQLTEKLKAQFLDLKVAQKEDLDFDRFDRLWNHERLNRLDFYISDLERMLRVGDMLPVPHTALWQSFEDNWTAARQSFRDTAEVVYDVFKVINRQFQDLYHKNYTNWILQPDAPVIFTHQFLPRMLKAHWDPKSGKKAVILVFDGLRTDAWDELVRPVLEERYDIIESRPGSALIPTETELSRKAISAGCMPAEFQGKSKRELTLLAAWLKENMGIEPQFEVLRDDDTIASGMTVRYQSKELDYIVFNFTDENLHHNSQDLAFIYNTTVREIIRQDVRSVLREMPPDVMVFITSDHGFTPMPPDPIDVGEEIVCDSNLIKFSSVRAARGFSGPEANKVISFDIRLLKVPIPDVPRGCDPVQRLLFARPGWYFRRGVYRSSPDRYSHGGLSLAECLVPMVVMGPKKVDTGLLYLEDARQVGAGVEGEPLELEITVRSGQMISDSLPVRLAFSLNEIPERMEFMTGLVRTYRVSWNPKIAEIKEEDREKGYIEFPVTVILSYRYKDQPYRTSRTVDVRMRIDSTRLRRRIDSKLDLMMGKSPGGKLIMN